MAWQCCARAGPGVVYAVAVRSRPIPLTEMAALSRLSSDQGEGEVRMGRREAACRFSCLNLRQAV